MNLPVMWKEIPESILGFAAGAVLALLLRCFVCLFARVKGESMRETLCNGDMVFALRRWLCGGPRRFDVVLCRYPGRREAFVKRVVGLPGERVALVSGVLHINGEAVEEHFLQRPTRQTTPEYTLGPDEFFVLGDNRPVSHDSRSVGPIRSEAIFAIATCVFLPPSRAQRLREKPRQ